MIATTPPYGTVEYYMAKLAAEGDEHDRRCALVGRLRECVEREDLGAARNLLAAFDQLHEAEAERYVVCSVEEVEDE